MKILEDTEQIPVPVPAYVYSEEEGYIHLLEDVLLYGTEKPIFDSEKGGYRDDVFVKSLFGVTQRFDLTKGFPLYTHKKTFSKGAFVEMLWFLKGTGDIQYLLQNDVNIWNNWAWKVLQDCMNSPSKRKYKAYFQNSRCVDNYADQETFIKFLKENPENPFVIPLHYTSMNKDVNDPSEKVGQMDWIVREILKFPDRKSYCSFYWNPKTVYGQSLQGESVVIAACHTHHHVVVNDGKLDLAVGIRSNDLFLGNPFNVAQYALLAHMYSYLADIPVGNLVIQITDAHIYSNHNAPVEEIIYERMTHKAPTFSIDTKGREVKSFADFEYEDFVISNYSHEAPLKGVLTTVGGF